MRYNLIALLLMFVCAFGAGAQAIAPSPRVAAVQYALANGLQLDASRTVVIAETNYMRQHAPKESTSASQRSSDAQAIARLIGVSVQVAAAKDVLECVRNYCAASDLQSVLTVDEPGAAEGGQGVLLQVYSPSQTPSTTSRGTTTLMVVKVRREGTGWIGVDKLAGPSVAPVRIPPANH
jgi:hypothetical protein